jgi:hypothetical protein
LIQGKRPTHQQQVANLAIIADHRREFPHAGDVPLFRFLWVSGLDLVNQFASWRFLSPVIIAPPFFRSTPRTPQGS